MSESCKECGNNDFPDGFMCLHCYPKGPISLLEKLLAKAKEKEFNAPTRRKLVPDRWIDSSCIPVIAIEDLETIIKELVS